MQDASAHLAHLDEWDDVHTSILPTLSSVVSRPSVTDGCTTPDHVSVGTVAPSRQLCGKPAGQPDRTEPKEGSSSPDLGPLVRSFPPVPTTISTDSSSPASYDEDRPKERNESTSPFTRSRTCLPLLDSDGPKQSECAQPAEQTEQPEQSERSEVEEEEERGPLSGPDPSPASPVPHSPNAKKFSVPHSNRPNGLGLQPPRSKPHLATRSTSSPTPSGSPLPSSPTPSAAKQLVSHRTTESRLPIKGLRTLPKPRPPGLATTQTVMVAPSSAPAKPTGSSLPRPMATSTSAPTTKDPPRHTTSSLPRPSGTRGTLPRSLDSVLIRPDHSSLPRPTTKGVSGTRSLPRPSKSSGLPLPTRK